MGCGHGGWRGVEVEGGLAGGDGAIDGGLGEGAAEGKAAGNRANPETLELPGGWGYGGREGAPGYETGGLVVNIGNEAAAVLLDVAVGEARGFLFQRAEAEAGCAGLGDDEAAVLKEKLASLSEFRFLSVCG